MIFAATLRLQTRSLKLVDASKVEVFGELIGPERAWHKKVICKKVSDSSYSANVQIKHGGKFKFIIDDGRAYATSDQYMETQDESVNIDNTYRFHTRTREANEAVISRYTTQAGKCGEDFINSQTR